MDRDRVHQIETPDQAILVDAPEQPVGMGVVAQAEIDDVGDRRRMQMGERPSHQVPRRQDDLVRFKIDALSQQRGGILGDDLEIAGEYGAGAGLDLVQRGFERSVGNEIIRHQKNEAGIADRIAGLAQRAFEGQRDRRRVIAVGDQIVDRADFAGAVPFEFLPRRMRPDDRFIGHAGQQNEPARQLSRDGRYIVRRQERRQAEFEEPADELVAPNRHQ